jgi:hypothetical protein
MSDDEFLTLRHDDGTCTCGACKQRVRPLGGPTPLGIASALAAVAMCVAGMPLIAVLPPVNMMLVPPTFFIVASLVGGAGGGLGNPRRCPKCSKYLVFSAPTRGRA